MYSRPMENKPAMINFKCSHEVMAEVKKAAKADMRSVSNFVLLAVLERVERLQGSRQEVAE
jgi:uncharacterized protein (DUF1778 family)